jgi:periplasmic divalent cation tolerance protein
LDTTELVVVLCTTPPGGADKIARTLVDERLAACVNITQVRSYFIWKDKPSDEREEMMIIKTEQRLLDRMKERIKELHSYEVPEIIAVQIVAGDEAFLQWISRSVCGP